MPRALLLVDRLQVRYDLAHDRFDLLSLSLTLTVRWINDAKACCPFCQ